MADTAYDSDKIRQAVADKGALAVIPNNPSRAHKHPLDAHLYAQRHPRRVLPLQVEAVPKGRNSLREDRTQLLRHRYFGRYRLVATISVHSS